MSAIEAPLSAIQQDEGRATHRHKKRGTEYVLLGYGRMQAESWLEGATANWSESGPSGFYDDKVSRVTFKRIDMREVAIYRSVDDGSLWVRPREEFEDGRFVALNPIPTDRKSADDGERREE